jgi:hypothetical protein
MSPVKREKNLRVMMSDDEARQLTELADHAGLSASDWIRQTIRRAHAETFPAPPPKPRKG